MAFAAVFDANVLYPAAQRDLLIRLAQVIVTNNVTDFPAGQLDEYGIEAQTADEFLVHLVDLRPALVAATLQRQADSLRDPPQTLNEVLARLERSGLTRTVAELRLHLEP